MYPSKGDFLHSMMLVSGTGVYMFGGAYAAVSQCCECLHGRLAGCVRHAAPVTP